MVTIETAYTVILGMVFLASLPAAFGVYKMSKRS